MHGSVSICYISGLLLLETPTGVELGRYHLLELLWTQEAPEWLNRRFLYLRIVTSWDPNRDKFGQLFSVRAFLSQEARARISLNFLYLLVVTSWDSNRGWVGKLSPLRAVMDTRSTWGAESQVFVLYLIVIFWDYNRGKLSSYSLLEFLLSQGARAWISH